MRQRFELREIVVPNCRSDTTHWKHVRNQRFEHLLAAGKCLVFNRLRFQGPDLFDQTSGFGYLPSHEYRADTVMSLTGQSAKREGSGRGEIMVLRSGGLAMPADGASAIGGAWTEGRGQGCAHG
jgi:hypothetical protein